jgi:hypothetical protein
MTLREVGRAIQSKVRVRKIEAQERASFEYIQATLIIKGVGIALGSKDPFPSVEEAYPGIFGLTKEEKLAEIEEKKMELAALRFRQFAQSYNKRFEEVPNKDNE